MIAALLAPIMMLSQARFVVAILAGRPVGWTPQRRESGGLPLHELWRYHRSHMVCGAALLVTALWISASVAAWLAPVLI